MAFIDWNLLPSLALEITVCPSWLGPTSNGAMGVVYKLRSNLTCSLLSTSSKTLVGTQSQVVFCVDTDCGVISMNVYVDIKPGKERTGVDSLCEKSESKMHEIH